METDNEELGIRETLQEINRKLDEGNKKKPQRKKFNLPAKAKVGTAKLKKGYVTVETIGENKEIKFVKEPIIDGTIKLGDTFHAVNDLDVFTYKGKPFVHQPKTKINPWNPLSAFLDSERTFEGKILNKNEIYGQKYIMASMKSDAIRSRKKVGSWIWLILVGIAGVVIYAIVKG